MKIDNNTRKIVSIAEKPGTFGLNFHNKGYELHGLNYIYLPLKVKPSELESILGIVRNNFHGCSVSMPYKVRVIKYLDELDDSSLRTGAVNTILNKKGLLVGFNTDIYSVQKSIEYCCDISNKEVVLVGAGGFARAVCVAVRNKNARLNIVNRNYERAEELARQFGGFAFPHDELDNQEGYLLINATSVGMENPHESIVSRESISRFEVVMDAVVSDTTRLISEAEELGKRVISGRTIATYQAVEQFRIYTGEQLLNGFISSFLKKSVAV